MKCNKPILLVLTGGTICSRADDTGHNVSDQAAAAPVLLQRLRDSHSPWKDVPIITEAPLNILSENTTITSWNMLLDFLRGISFEKYQGILIAHGTDTLAYSASLLSFALAGITVPVIIPWRIRETTEQRTLYMLWNW